MSTQNQNSLVSLGRLGRPKGLKGDLYFDLYNDHSEYLKAGSEVCLGADTRRSTIDSISASGRRHVIHFSQVESRESAERLTGTEVRVPRSWLPELEEDEFYVCDLLGFEVLNSRNESLGMLKEVREAPSNQIYVVEGEDGEEKWVPLLKGVFKRADLASKRVWLDPWEEVDAF